MENFEFYQDVKTTIWVRQYFTVKASTQEEANKMAMKYKNSDVSKDFDSGFTECEGLYDTEELVLPSENNGLPTIELFTNTGKWLGDNSIKAD